MSSKPRVLVLGGVGFIGRNFVRYLVENDLCSFIRVIDKQMPQIAYFSQEMEAAFKTDVVEYKQGDLTRPATIEKAFEGDKFNFVFNLAAETRLGQDEQIYKEKVHDLAVKVAEAAKVHGVDKFIEVSAAHVYEGGSKPSAEDGKIKPWTTVAKYKAQAEEALKAIGLPLVILRPAIVYGPGDVLGLSPRIMCAAAYKKMGEKMKFLWGSDLKINTVHVVDVCRALWHSATELDPGSVYNLCDHGNTDQGKVSGILETIFGIKTGFYNSIVSNMARANISYVAEEANEKHMQPWSDLCKEHDILNTPLTPHIDKELVYNNHLHIDGTAIEKTGFTYDVPEVTEERIREQIDYYLKQNVFPPIL